MAEAATVETHGPEHDAHDHHGPQGILKYIWSTDHKIIAMQYLFTGMFMALIGGFFAYAFRMQLAFPGMDVPFWERIRQLELDLPVERLTKSLQTGL